MAISRSRGRRSAAQRGDLCRRVKRRDEDGHPVELCKREVPPGTLPYLAWNTGTGSNLMLCSVCRAEAEGFLEDILDAEVSTGRLSGSFLTLSTGQLVSQEELREILRERLGTSAGKSGPLNKKDQLEAIECEFGAEERRRFVESNRDYQGV